jgi:hypothetical protein
MRTAHAFLWLLAGVLIISAPIFAASYGGGSGTETDPYQIWTAEQMNTIGANLDDWGKSFILMADIDMSTYTGTQYNRIGKDYTPFNGNFDGDGHIVRNLTYTTVEFVSQVGLFGIIGSGAFIKNLGMENVNMLSGGSNIGGLVGYNSGRIAACYSTGTVIGIDNVGGLVGHNFFSSTITSCYSAGTVNGETKVGGLVGYNNGGTITSCFTKGIVTGTIGVGGIVGWNGDWSVSISTITSCYATGDVKGNDNIGGLVGYNAGHITTCYSNGMVNGIGFNCGGLIGWNGGNIISCFWDIQTSNQTTSEWGVGLSTAAMKASETYFRAGWDFKGEIVNGIQDTWTMPIDGGYPILRWQISAMSGPENDDMPGAVEVHAGDSVAGSSEVATGIDLTKNGYNDYRDIWYLFVPDEEGQYSISVQGSFDTTLGIFDQIGREVAFNDDFFGGKSEVILKATAGQQYFLRVAGYGGQTGDFTLTIEKGAIQMIQGDLNYDGKVNLVDLSLMAQHWLMGV